MRRICTILVTMLPAVLTAKNKRKRSTFDREDITVANTCPTVWLALRINVNKVSQELPSKFTSVK